jgi:hypothetical protein
MQAFVDDKRMLSKVQIVAIKVLGLNYAAHRRLTCCVKINVSIYAYGPPTPFLGKPHSFS